jgi:hypothetical protein
MAMDAYAYIRLHLEFFDEGMEPQERRKAILMWAIDICEYKEK